MADRSKFEQMLELLVNENKEAAEELFHEIVVEKSRDIYESLLEDEEADEDIDESDDNDEDDEEVDESSDDDLDEGFDLDEFQVSGDATDDFANDVDSDSEDDGDMSFGSDEDDMDSEEGDNDMESRIMDLEDAFEELKAEFEAMMDGEDDEEDDSDEGDMDFGDEEDDSEEGEMDFGDEEDDSEDEIPSEESFTYEAKKPKDEKKDKKPVKKTAGEEMREYVEKIGGAQYNQFGKMGDNGTNTKSIVAGKNNMGGTTANILRTDTEQGTEANKGQIKGSSLIKQNPQDMNTKNINVPGGKAGVKHLKSMPKGHGAEKKGAGETADKSAGSMLNGAPKRAK